MQGNLLSNRGNSMQLYKAVVDLRCIFLLYLIIHRKQQNGPQEERDKKYSIKWFYGVFYLGCSSIFYLFLTSGNCKQPDMKLYHKAELQKRIHVPTVV